MNSIIISLTLLVSSLFSLVLSAEYTSKFIAGSGVVGNLNGPGLSATFNQPFGCAISPDSTYGLLADSGNGELRKISVNANRDSATVTSLLNLPNIHSLCFTNQQTAWVTNIATVQRIDLTTLTPTIIATSVDLAAIACSHDGNKILIATYRGVPNPIPRPVYILSSSTTQRVNLTVLGDLPDDSLGITFSPDDTFAVATTLANGLYKIIISSGVATKLNLPRNLQTPLGISFMNGEYLILEPAVGVLRHVLDTNILLPINAPPDSYAICTSPDNSYGLLSLYQRNRIAIITPTASSPTLSPTVITNSRDYTFSIVAGSGTAGSHDDVGLAATFNQPWGCAISNDNTFGFIADTGNMLMRKYTFATGAVTTVATNLRVGFIAINPARLDMAYYTSPEGIHQFDIPTSTSTQIATLASLGALAVSSNGQFLLAVSYKGTNIDTSPRIVYKWSSNTNLEELFTIPFDSLGITISTNHLFAYLTALYSGLLYRIDLTTKVMTTLPLPRTLSGPTGLVLVDGSYLLITEYLGVGISRYNLITNELIILKTVTQANAICMSRDSSLGLVSLLTANKIAGLFSSPATVFTSSPTNTPTLSPTMELKTSSPTPEIINRPSRNYTFSIIAGSGTVGSHDDVGLAATFNQPWGCAISTDNSYGLIADTGNKLLRKITIGSSIVQTIIQTNEQIGFICLVSSDIAYFTSNHGIYHLDLKTMESTIIASVTMLGAISCSSDHQFLLATTHKGITSDLTLRSIYKLSLNNNAIETIVSVPFDSLGITISYDNLFAYVTALSEGSIYRIDLTTKSLTMLRLPRTLSGPTGIASIEFGSYLLITEYLGIGISRYNLVTGELILLANVTQANAICMSSDSSIGLVSLLTANKIGFIQRESNGNDLRPGQCCIPGKNDHYCSYNGVCDETGTTCICTDPLHYSSSDRCMNYYSNNLPDTCPPLQFPYIPTQRPTPSPTLTPTRQPIPVVCTPGDRIYCSGRGTCNTRGDECNCDDAIHYWSSDNCLTRHEGPELEPGQFCSPGKSDSYCSYMGICNNEGTECECFDPIHRLSIERCQTWHAITNGVCSPYDRVYCSNRGICSSTGDGCLCDDEQHYWSSDRCSKRHPGPQLASESQCCSPDQVDTYCNYMGKCNSEGTKCLCFDYTHRLSSERCLIYHTSLTTEEIQENNLTTPVNEAACPGFLDENENKNNNEDSNNENDHLVSTILIAVGVTVGVAFTAMILLFLAQKHKLPTSTNTENPTNTGKKVRMSWYEENPIRNIQARLSRTESSTSTGSAKIRRQSSLNPFGKREESYVEISEVTMPSEMLEEQNIGTETY